MSVGLRFELNSAIFLKNPQDTDVGRRIIQHSIELIHELGFEAFNFKKLANKINTTEASVYRYFPNKHLLLIYLLSWYWEWVHFLVNINLSNIDNPEEKLKIVIYTLINARREDQSVPYVNEELLHWIVISEGSKAYHTKQVDEENKEGMFWSYKNLCMRVADIISELNPEFPYPRSLASNLFEMANNQIHFAHHLPRLTDISDTDSEHSELREMMEFYAFKLLES